MSRIYIELDRRFEKYLSDDTPENLAERSYIRAFLGDEPGVLWGELLQHRLVVVLGEPGSGKTSELWDQQRRRSLSSFFLELNRLVDEDVNSILDEDENRRFLQWKNGNGEVTFFLDAVDESKLEREGDFFTALDRVKKAIGPALSRSRFVISSRISEWRPEADREGVQRRLGIGRFSKQSVAADENDSPVNRGFRQAAGSKQENTEQNVSVLVVTLLPLTPLQVEYYASARGMKNPRGFITALGENNAWAFSARPLDVEFLYEYWNEKGHLGNLTELSEYMIDKLLAEVPDRERQDVLYPARAREGAEFLAAAVVFCRRLKFRISEGCDIAGGHLLSPADVLPEEWRPRDRLALMDRALFDAASLGAMSFHHRYHADYLAAAWIARLMNSGCGVAELDELLFSTVKGERVMRPALKSVAAWLVKEGDEPWRVRLAEWILESCPEIHLAHGDPAALSVEYRRKVLGKLIERYQGRNLVHLNLDQSALARFANAGLADEVSRYILDNAIAENLRIDLLLVVRSGKLHACIPAVLEIFADPSVSDNLRSYVTTVIRDAGNEEHRRQLASLWQALPEISNTHLACLCEALFPQAIGVDGLLALLRRSGEVREHSVDLPYYLASLLRKTLDAQKARELLGGVLSLLSNPPLMKEPPLSDHFGWTISLIPVCLQFMLSNRDLSDEDQESAISAVFVLEQADHLIDLYRLQSDAKNEPSPQQLVEPHASLRRRLFWTRVARHRDRHGREPSRFELGSYGAVVELVQIDVDWLLADAGSNLPLEDRRLALDIAANMLWTDRLSLLFSIWKLLPYTRGNAELLVFCRQHLWNRLCSPFMRVWYGHLKHKLLDRYWWSARVRRIRKFRQKIQDRWWMWHHLGEFRKGLQPYTLAHLARLAGKDNSSQYGGSDWGKVEKEWGKTIADAARQGCVVGWRQFLPLLPHENPERNAVDNRLFVGLAGLQTLWRADRLNLASLSAEEVDLLVRYACNELNGFPEWFSPLLAMRPDDVGRTLEMAAAGEWRYPASMEHVHDVVAKLAWMPDSAEVLARVVMSRLQMDDPFHPRMLDYALTVVMRSSERVPDNLIDITRTRVCTYTPEQPQWFSWMKVWLQLDAFPALDYLESVLLKSAGKADDLVVNLCGTLSGQYDEQLQVNNPSYLKQNALARLIPLVHRHVRASDDIDRANGGVYRSGPRDHAQRFRSRLLEILASSKEAEAGEVLRGFLNEPSLAGDRDWLLHLLDERKYLLVDDAPWESGDVREFAKVYRSEPRSDYQLFRLIGRLLLDVKNHVEASENAAGRLPLRKGDLEKDLRGILCEALTRRSLDWFNAVQEREVDLGQKPDLSIERPGLNSLPIELKLANKWTVDELLAGLETQLVGQYLRPANVCYGIYVLGNIDPKRRWKVLGTGELIDFRALVVLIQDRAAALQIECRAEVEGIEVIGIDFSDPRER